MIMYIDWNDAFDNSSYVSESEQLADRWAAESADYRQAMLARDRAELDIVYGDDQRNRLDLFRGGNRQEALIVFIHGGYWHKFDKSYWSFLAQGAIARGWSVAIPSYTLAPYASISRITQEIGKAIMLAAQKVDGPIRLIGHSAGGHLVTRMLCGDTPLDESTLNRIEHVVPVSGIYDLRPLLLTRMNNILRMSEREARDESPALHIPMSTTPVTLWVGDCERPEFLRQTRLMCEKWQGKYEHIHAVYQTGKNHFSVIEDLAITDSKIVNALTA